MEPQPSPSSAATETIKSYGLKLRSQLVMSGAAVWPAALALCAALRERPALAAGASICELGAGAGAPGLVCACLGARRVLLTDGDTDLLVLLRVNVSLNAPSFGEDAGPVVCELEW